MTRKALAVLAVIVLAGGLFTGCASQRHAEYTSTGAGIGAVTGAILGGVIGSMSGRAGEGVVIGGILGGLTGASVGSNEYHLQRSEEAAVREYDYRRQEEVRDLVRIEDASASPRVVYPGEDVTLSATFTVLTPSGGTRLVREVREVRKEGRLIGRPEVTTRRDGGTWTSSMPLRLQPDAEYGTYVVTTIIETDNAGDVREATFRVEPGSQWKR
ncbi:MAG: hypothetical protein HZA22_00390 [Nitrospirae bacterium]|nr:hypothetical protein [Nitrospirota bacterium]